MKSVYIIDCARTGVGSFGGSLSMVKPSEMVSGLIKSILQKNFVLPKMVDEVLLGCVLQAGNGQNVARQAAIHSGIPVEKTAVTINMVCGSGLRSVMMGAQSILCQDAELIITGGVENMSMAPYLLPKARTGYRLGNGELVDSVIYDGLFDIFNQYHMGITAENLAEKYKIPREEQDLFAVSSQNKAETAKTNGFFDAEIIPIEVKQRKGDPIAFKEDEYIRTGVKLENLSKLAPAFRKNGTVTAGNSSGINDGAACVLLASEEQVKKLKLTPMARIVSYAYTGTDPAVMGIGPVDAVRLALKKADWVMDDLDLVEANEAFAAQAIAVNHELKWNPDIVNVKGGSIAIGHPIGASGARILTTLVHEMQRNQKKKGLATLCIGGGMGAAICLEKV